VPSFNRTASNAEGLYRSERAVIRVVDPNAWTDVRWLGGLCAPDVNGETDRTGCLAYPPEGKHEERSGVESSRGRHFATSTGFGKIVFVSAMKMSSIDFD
jgi:hypothetical protein